MDNTQHAEIIDFNAEWMHRRILYHMNANEWQEAEFLSATLEGYLEGLFAIEFRGGEPMLSLTEVAQGRLEGLTNDEVKGLIEGPST